MKLYYCHDERGNFGDDLNLWLWDALLPGWQGWRDDTTLVGVGTVFNSGLPVDSSDRFLIVGSGVGYHQLPDISDPETWDIRAVRGPQSTELLGISKELGMIDPAALIPDMAEFQNLEKSDRPIFVPHVASANRHDWHAICDRAGIEFVSPCGDSKEVIRKIGSAPYVITESMHGAIFADAFRVPWQPVKISGVFNRKKWSDWLRSVGLDSEIEIPTLFPALEMLAKIRSPWHKPRVKTSYTPADAHYNAEDQKQNETLRRRVRFGLERVGIQGQFRKLLKKKPYLSAEGVAEVQKQRLYEALEGIKRDYQN